MITVTPQAIDKIQQQLSRRGQGLGIRVGVRTTGCSGLAYVLEYVDTATLGLDCFEFDDVKIYIDRKDQVYLQGLMIDYQRQNLNEGFKFSNPNEKNRCGCGESFNI